MTGMSGTPAVRLVWRAADAIARTPASVTETCSRCRHCVLVDRHATPDPPGRPLPLACVPCAVADPEMRQSVIRTWEAARRLGSVLPPANAKKGTPWATGER